MKGHCEIRVSLGQHSALRDTMGTNSPLVFIQDGPRVQHKMMPQLQTEGSWEGRQVRCEVNRPLKAGQTEVWQLPLGILGLPSSPTTLQSDPDFLCLVLQLPSQPRRKAPESATILWPWLPSHHAARLLCTCLPSWVCKLPSTVLPPGLCTDLTAQWPSLLLHVSSSALNLRSGDSWANAHPSPLADQ